MIGKTTIKHIIPTSCIRLGAHYANVLRTDLQLLSWSSEKFSLKIVRYCENISIRATIYPELEQYVTRGIKSSIAVAVRLKIPFETEVASHHASFITHQSFSIEEKEYRRRAVRLVLEDETLFGKRAREAEKFSSGKASRRRRQHSTVSQYPPTFR